MEILQWLLNNKEALRGGEHEALKCAESRKIYHAFDKEGHLLAAGKKELCLTGDGKVIFPFDAEGALRENLAKEKREGYVLYLIRSSTTCAGRRMEIPLPDGFEVREIICQDNVFAIVPTDGDEAIFGAFNVMEEALMLVESLYHSGNGAGEDAVSRCYYEYLAEDHQKYLQRMENEKKVSAANSRTAKRENFHREKSGEYVCRYMPRLWSHKTEVSASYGEKTEKPGKILSDLAKQLNIHTKWIDQNRELIQRAILKEDMVELACQWMEGQETVGKDGKSCYEMEDGSLLPCPITEEVFLKSLYIQGINANCTNDRIDFDIFIGTEPDFFACHSIEVFLTVTAGCDYQISVGGLAG